MTFNKIPGRRGPDILKIEHIHAELISVESKLDKKFRLQKIQIKRIVKQNSLHFLSIYKYYHLMQIKTFLANDLPQTAIDILRLWEPSIAVRIPHLRE